jgi:hypothetical protein
MSPSYASLVTRLAEYAQQHPRKCRSGGAQVPDTRCADGILQR